MKDKIRKELQRMNVVFTDEVVDALASRVDRYPNAKNKKSIARFIAHNWAIDQRLRLDRAARHTVQVQIEQAEVEWKRVRFLKALAEFDQLVPTLTSDRPCMPDALRYMRLVCLENKSDPECAPFFPGSKRDQRYQWLKRARDLVLPHVSAKLKTLLWRKLGTKRKAV